jgi:hypothetical protein
MQKPEVERQEHEDNANVGREPLPDVALEEQDVHGDHDTRHCNHVQRAGCRPSHGATLVVGGDEARLRERSLTDA